MKIVDFLIGLAVLFMGVLPFITSIPSISESTEAIGAPGGMIYQIILIGIGIAALIYAFSGRRQAR